MDQTMDGFKFYLLLGGFLGFSLTLFAGLFSGSNITVVVRNAAIGAVIGGVLVRAWLYIFAANVRVAMNEQRRRARAAEMQARAEEASES